MAFLTGKTKRLTVRPLKPTDYAAWKTASSTMLPQRNKWDRKNRPQTEVSRAHFKKVLASQKRNRSEDRFYDLAIFENASRNMIGTVAIMDDLRGAGQCAYIGYFIFNRHWGRGFGKEATRALIDIAFRDLKLHRVEAGIEPTNRRSIMLARSLGLRKEGLKKRAVFLRGTWNDLLIYSSTCEEFGIRWRGNAPSRIR